MRRLQRFDSLLVELRSLEVHAVQFVIGIKLGELHECLYCVLVILIAIPLAPWESNRIASEAYFWAAPSRTFAALSLIATFPTLAEFSFSIFSLAALSCH